MPDLDAYVQKWTENEESIEVYADILYLTGTDLTGGEKHYIWRVNATPESLGSDTYSEKVGEEIIKENGETQNMDAALEGRKKSEQRAEDIVSLLEDQGINTNVDEASFSEPEYNTS
jgi:hypothetical protein